MRLTSTQVERALNQFDAQAIPEDHPVMAQLSVPTHEDAITQRATEEDEARNDRGAQVRVRPAMKHLGPAKHADSWLDVDYHLSDAECDEAEVISRDALQRDARPHMKWREWHGGVRDG